MWRLIVRREQLAKGGVTSAEVRCFLLGCLEFGLPLISFCASPLQIRFGFFQRVHEILAHQLGVGSYLRDGSVFEISCRLHSGVCVTQHFDSRFEKGFGLVGTPCIILRQANGTLSGYAAVEPGHPLYGYNHDAIPTELRMVSHGGLNYAEACNQTMPEAVSVCHVEPPKRPHSDMPDRFAHDGDLWWFGFDTNHAYDFVPNERIPQGQRIHDGKVYRDQAYVYRECIKLAAQLHRIETGVEVPIPAHLQQTIPPIGGTE